MTSALLLARTCLARCPSRMPRGRHLARPCTAWSQGLCSASAAHQEKSSATDLCAIVKGFFVGVWGIGKEVGNASPAYRAAAVSAIVMVDLHVVAVRVSRSGNVSCLTTAKTRSIRAYSLIQKLSFGPNAAPVKQVTKYGTTTDDRSALQAGVCKSFDLQI